MANTVSNPILQVLRRVVEDQRTRVLPDQELLERFTAGHDEAAFHTLLRRHGPMVLSVCRALLPSEADAEDAFQATFLVFAHKAGSIHQSSSLGSWLHGVAYRTARKAQAEFAKRQKHERRASRREGSLPDDLSWGEVQRVVHEELSGLSERYRAALVLCYLQGKTLDEAAVQLGLTKGTLKVRLERGRGLLRVRLVRRGLGPAAVLLASAWPASATAGLPTVVLSSTVEGALRVAAGQAPAGLISPKAAALAEGVLNAMLITKLKTVTAALTMLALVGLSLGGLAYTPAAQQPDAGDGRQLPALAAVAQRPPAEQQAIAALQAVGGRVILDRAQPGEPVVGVYLLSRQVTDGDYKHLKEFKSLKTLVLPGITDPAMKEIRGLTSLEYLRARPEVKAALKDLGELKNLRQLDLEGFDEPELKNLRGLTNLRALKLSPWRDTPDGLKELGGLKELRSLELAFAYGTPEEERRVEAGLKELSGLQNLEELNLKTGLDDAGLGELAKLKGLRVLHLSNNKVTDAGLAELKSLPNLRRLFLWHTRVTDAGVADLKKALPNLEVTKDVPDTPPRSWEDFERISGKAKVIDAKTLLFDDGRRVPLNMRVPEPGARGAAEAAEFLAKLIGDRPVTCFLVEAQLAYIGYVGEVNIEHAMIINGWARSHHSSMRPAETIARENRRGLWSGKLAQPAR
jgi:RNA polymerase sigma factor (sigma-70 family)